MPRPQSHLASLDPRRSQSESSFEIRTRDQRLAFVSPSACNERVPGHQLHLRHICLRPVRLYAHVTHFEPESDADMQRAVVGTIREGAPVYSASSSESKKRTREHARVVRMVQKAKLPQNKPVCLYGIIGNLCIYGVWYGQYALSEPRWCSNIRIFKLQAPEARGPAWVPLSNLTSKFSAFLRHIPR